MKDESQFANAVIIKRGVGTIRKRKKYLHFIMNEQLFNLSANGLKLLAYIQLKISSSEYNEATKYYVAIDIDFKNDYIKFLSKKGIDISIRTIENAVKELVDNKVLIKLRRSKYLYNFVDFAHVGNNEQWEIDKREYDIISILERITNK